MGFANPPATAAGGQYIRSATLAVAASDSKDTRNVDYVCDGTDDQVEINAAIAALPAGGGLIHLLEGTYNVSGPITIDRDNVAIIGTGANTVIRIRDGHNAAINVITATNHSNLLIKDLRIDGNRANQVGVWNMWGIYFNTVDNSIIASCQIDNIFRFAIYLEGSSHNRVSGNTFYNNTHAINIFNSSNGNTVDGNVVRNSDTYGIYLHVACNYNAIGDNVVENSDIGIYLFNDNSNNTITGNTCNDNERYGIYLGTDADYNTVVGNTCEGNDQYGIFVGAADGNVVSDNVCEGNDRHGIYVFGSDHNTITGNSVINNGLDADNTYDGIIVTNDSDYNNVQGNTVRTTVAAPPPNRQRYGLNIATADCDGNYAGDNDLWQSGQTGALNDAGTNTRFPPDVAIVASTLVVAATDSIDPTRADYQCDGVSDETEINAAVVALGATGGTVKLLEGTFTVDGNIVLASNVALVGQGAGTVITIPDGHDVAINIIYGTGIDHVLVKDLRIDGNRANQTAGVMYGIYFDTVTYSKIESCWVEEIYGASGIYLVDASDYNAIEGNIVTGNDLGGIYLINNARHNTIVGNTCSNNTNGIYLINNCDYNTITGNTSNNNTGAGIILANGMVSCTITGNTCAGNGGIGIGLDTMSHSVFVGNIIQGNGQHGIYIDGLSNDNTISCNTITGNSQTTDNTYDGIFVEDSDYNDIQGNTIRHAAGANQHRYGINVSNAACDGNLVKNNDLYQSGRTASFNDAGTATKLPELWVNSIFDDSDPNASIGSIGGALGMHVGIVMADNQDVEVRFNFRVPSDFHELVRARVVVVPDYLGPATNMRRAILTGWGLCNELHDAGGGAIAAGQVSVNGNEINCLDIDAALAGITAGDHVGVRFTREATNVLDTVDADVHLLQFWMQYV